MSKKALFVKSSRSQWVKSLLNIANFAGYISIFLKTDYSKGVLKTKTPKTPKDPLRPQNLKTTTPPPYFGGAQKL